MLLFPSFSLTAASTIVSPLRANLISLCIGVRMLFHRHHLFWVHLSHRRWLIDCLYRIDEHIWCWCWLVFCVGAICELISISSYNRDSYVCWGWKVLPSLHRWYTLVLSGDRVRNVPSIAMLEMVGDVCPDPTTML